jgi:hypothetical protein
MQQPESAPAEAGTIGFDHGKYRRHGDCGIESISAPAKDIQAGPGRKRVSRSDGRLLGLERGTRPSWRQPGDEENEAEKSKSARRVGQTPGLSYPALSDGRADRERARA